MRSPGAPQYKVISPNTDLISAEGPSHAPELCAIISLSSLNVEWTVNCFKCINTELNTGEVTHKVVSLSA